MVHHRDTERLFNMSISSDFIPSILLPTIITHISSTLIDNIYIKLNFPNYHADVIIGDISDNLPCIFSIR